MSQLRPVPNLFSSIYFAQGFSTCNSIFMFLICLKHFLTYRMKPHSTTWHAKLWQTSLAASISLLVLLFPGFPSSCSSPTHQPVSCSIPFHLPFSLHLSQWVKKFLLTFEFHLKHHCSWEPLTMSFLANFRHCIYCPELELLLPLSRLQLLKDGPALIHMHLSSLTQCLAQMSTWEVFAA